MSDYAHEAIDEFKITLNFERGISTYDNGVNTFNVTDTGTFEGVIQPASQASLQFLPEGQRANIIFTLHTRDDFPVSIPDNPEADTFIPYKNKRYKVVSPADWSNQKFFKYGLGIVQPDR